MVISLHGMPMFHAMGIIMTLDAVCTSPEIPGADTHAPTTAR